MSITIELTRAVKADKYHLIMQLGRLSDQRHIIAFLKRANENSDKKISSNNITDDLLRKLPESVGRRMIQRCVDLQVMEWVNDRKFGKLTKLGEEAIKDEKIFQFERDLYEVIYTNDPLIPSLIDCIPLNELANLSNEIKIANSQEKNKSLTNVEIISEQLKNKLCSHNKLYPIGKQKGPIIIKKIEKYGAKLPDIVNLKLKITIEENGKVTLATSGDYKEYLNPPQLSFSKIYNEIITHQKIHCNHQFNKNTLRINYDEIDDDDQRRLFKKDLSLQNVMITGLGNFDKVTVIDQPIMPDSENDAQKWSEWLMEDSVKGFITSQEFVEYLSGIETRMKGYIPTFTLKKIGQRELANRIKIKNIGKLPKKYWYVKAPLDLAVGVNDNVN